MEQKYSAPVDKVFALLTDPRWLEARCLALGELSASVKAKKAGKGVAISMKRRVKRELPALVAKVMPSEADLVFEEPWGPDEDGVRSGTLSMSAVGQPITMTANFELAPAGKGSLYRITHVCKCSVPLVGGAVAKFAQGQVEEGCAAELAYLVDYLKKHK